MPSVGDLLAGGLVSLVYLGLLALAELWQRNSHSKPELTRKLVHLSGGIVSISLPFVIQSHWVVLAMALGMACLFLAGISAGFLKSLHGVSRQTRGTVYYPFAIYVLFYLAGDQPWKYVICVLTLALSDTLAALIGIRFGKIHYEVEDESKSLEGSLAFLVATFLIVFLTLVLWPDLAIPELVVCVLVALLVAILIAGVEAISLNGSDNLWVPIATYVVLTKMLHLPYPFSEVLKQYLILAVISGVIGLSAWKLRAFNVGGAVLFILSAYTCWWMGSFCWAFPVFLGYAVYLLSRCVGRELLRIRVRPVLLSLWLPLVIFGVACLVWGQEDFVPHRYFFGPFLAGCTIVVMQVTWNQVLRDWTLLGWHRQAGLGVLTLGCWAVIAVPSWLVQHHVPPESLLSIAVACLLIGYFHDGLVGKRPPKVFSRREFIMHFLLTSGTMAIVAGLQSTGICSTWNPW